MSTDVTMQELELETAELLPARETLNACGRYSRGHSNSYNVNQFKRATTATATATAQSGAAGNRRWPATRDGNLNGNTHPLAPARLEAACLCIA